MRLAVCTLSAVLLSGCSWLGYGGAQVGNNTFSTVAGCGQTGAYGNQYAYGSQYSQQGYAGSTYSGCGAGNVYAANGYGATQNGVTQGGLVQGGYGMQTVQPAMGLRGAQSVATNYNYNAASNGYGMTNTNGYAAGGGSQFINGRWVASTQNAGNILGNAAPYGAAVGRQYANMNGQWATGTAGHVAGGYGGGYTVSGNVKTVQGAPIYVPQPYPAYYSVGCANNVSYSCGGLRGGSTALPFGIEAGIGTNIAIGGDIIGDKPGGPALGGPVGSTVNTSGTSAVSYGDAYKNAVSYDLGITYDIDPSTTILGRVGYSKAEGELLRVGTIDDSTFIPAPATVTTEDLYAQWSDLEQWTVEGGVRKYMGGWNNTVSGLRPYVQATAGFIHNNDVSLTQSSTTLMPVGTNVQPYIDAGWTPTASGAIGAEMQVGPRTAIGVEAGVRWSDDLNTITQSDDRWSVPVRLRGRVSF